MGLTTVVHRFLVFYFPGWGKHKDENMALARLIGRLKKAPNPIYDPLGNSFVSGFAGTILALQTICESLRPLYLRIFGPGGATRRSAVDAALWVRLGQLGLTPESFVFPGSPPPPPDQTPEDWDRTFDARLATLRHPQMAAMTKGLLSNFRVSDLCEFDFGSLAVPFKLAGPKGHKVPAGPVASAFLDLYFLLPGWTIDQATLEAFQALATASGFEPGPAVEDLKKLASLLKNGLEPGRLADVLRCIHENPTLELRVAPTPADPVGPVVQALSDDWNAARIEYLRVQAEHEFQAKLATLFGNVPLALVSGYDASVSTTLVEHGLSAYRHVRPLRALKNFLLLLYLPTYREALGGFFFDMEFLDRRFKANLITAVDGVDKTAGVLEQFEEDCQVFVKTRITPFLEVLKNNLMGRSSKDSLKTAIEGLDLRADAMIQEAFGAMSRLRAGLVQIQEDWSNRNPNVISNAAYLNHHSPHIPRLVDEMVVKLEQMSGLMREVAVDVQAVKAFLGGGDGPEKTPEPE